MVTRSKITRLILLVLMSCSVISVYVMFFKHPPADELLLMNQQSDVDGANDFGASSFGGSHSDSKEKIREDDGEDNTEDEDNNENNESEDNKDDEDIDNENGGGSLWNRIFGGGSKDDDKKEEKADDNVLKEESEDEEVEEEKPSHKQGSGSFKASGSSSSGIKGAEKWNRFLKTNNFVPIGVVYSKCDGPREQLGTVAMIKDEINGGVAARTFMNITFKKEITGGQFYIEVLYNGKPLYDNYWEICEMEEDVPLANRTFTCPIKKGPWRVDKIRHVPNYLPKGHFQSKAWAVDEDKKMIACGFSDFKL